MDNRRIYLDHNATTPLSPRVREALTGAFSLSGNASSMHAFGREARAAVEQARESVAALINAAPGEIYFTASGSESNNTVLKTLLAPPEGSLFSKGRRALVTSVIEHPCVLQTAAALEAAGTAVRRLGVDARGVVDPAALPALLDDRTGLVSVMLANNEIGTVQDVRALVDAAHQAGALFHTDAVQAVGKIPVDVRALDVDYLTFSAHKLYGPKGVGVLYVRKGAPLAPLIHGGHQEQGLRAGTYNTQGIIGLGEAAREARELLPVSMMRERALRDRLLAKITAAIPDVRVNGDPATGLPNTLNVSFAGAEGESILLYLDMEGIAVSTGSACATGSLEPSYVLMATGLGAELAHGSIRFSLGRETTEADIDHTVAVLTGTIEKIRSMSTVYQGGKK